MYVVIHVSIHGHGSATNQEMLCFFVAKPCCLVHGALQGQPTLQQDAVRYRFLL
jgi:hypothetical protein